MKTIYLKALFLIVMLFFLNSVFSQDSDFFSENEKIYINEDEFMNQGDAFHIHLGHNIWLVANTVHRDGTGLYTYSCHLNKTLKEFKTEYEKKWKCPYCHRYWPIGKACQNPDCPSKYKDNLD